MSKACTCLCIRIQALILKAELEKRGTSVFVSEVDIAHGLKWPKVIGQAMEDCKVNAGSCGDVHEQWDEQKKKERTNARIWGHSVSMEGWRLFDAEGGYLFLYCVSQCGTIGAVDKFHDVTHIAT